MAGTALYNRKLLGVRGAVLAASLSVTLFRRGLHFLDSSHLLSYLPPQLLESSHDYKGRLFKTFSTGVLVSDWALFPQCLLLLGVTNANTLQMLQMLSVARFGTTPTASTTRL